MSELNERLLAHWAAWGSPTNREACVNEDRMAFDCREAAVEIAALRVDAMRYRWLRDDKSLMSWQTLNNIKKDRRKKWRYPGVPIPMRLQHRYKP